MKKFILLLLSCAALAAPLSAQETIGEVNVSVNGQTLPVRVSANTPDLNALALQAFGVHGRYHVVASGYLYDIRFSLVSPTQVQVNVEKGPGGGSVVAEVVAGTSARNALLRAADVAVERTNGLGLHGFFASKLACIGERTGHEEIYLGDLFFGNERQITNDRAIAMTPRWSPDGGKLIYTSYYHSGFPDIFVISLNANASSFERTTFVSFRGTNSDAHFSPDGRRVAMVLSGEGTPEIYVSDAQGHMVSRKTHYDSTKASPCWSPDGSRIVFVSEPGPQLYMISASGGGMQRLTFNISRYCAEPDWSRANPDKIAFTMGTSGNHYQIAVYDFSKRASQQVSHAPFDGIEPVWLADGRHLVYTARNAYASRLCILDTVTGKSTPISPTSFGPAKQGAVWSQ
jgi:TolB protein